MIVDADLLLNYQRCNRRAFLDTYGDPLQRDPTNDYLVKIIQDSQLHHQAVIASLPYSRPIYPQGDWQAGAAATLAMMQQGADRIYQGVLLAESEGVTLLSIPDLLVKQPGQSIFGDWLYMPMDIKLGKRPKLEYQVIAAFHSYVLAQVQSAWAEQSWLILRERGEYPVDLWEVLPRFQEILTGCIQTLRDRQEPEVFIARNRCSLCHWFSHCYAIAKATHHLSLLPGVTPVRYAQLQELQLTTVRALAETNPAQLEPLSGFGRDNAYKLVRQARSTLQNRAVLIEETTDRLSNAAIAHPGGLPNRQPSLFLPTTPIELYFDIEAEPALNLVYLHGVLVIDRQNQSQVFHAFLAENPNDEALVWHQFLDLVWQYPTAPIFHFCPFEVQTVERLAKLYGSPPEKIRPLLPRFIDLHDWVTRLVTLPVESYALKSIARWVGFEWRDPAASGAQAVYWYSRWLETGDRAFLEAILVYNEDDCHATYRVKDWLVRFLTTVYQAELA